ncbi:hypothetical protein E2C01_072760 [Portunus trituberculatus]|uniref:Uncharacterized protein n=1 Tax=Portunus trituberculatus TaxID=210409 RepID=A0A5B7I804_PORTR|nr:hypothetical protein [Portunus trituberculatus]
MKICFSKAAWYGDKILGEGGAGQSTAAALPIQAVISRPQGAWHFTAMRKGEKDIKKKLYERVVQDFAATTKQAWVRGKSSSTSLGNSSTPPGRQRSVTRVVVMGRASPDGQGLRGRNVGEMLQVWRQGGNWQCWGVTKLW